MVKTGQNLEPAWRGDFRLPQNPSPSQYQGDGLQRGEDSGDTCPEKNQLRYEKSMESLSQPCGSNPSSSLRLAMDLGVMTTSPHHMAAMSLSRVWVGTVWGWQTK